LNLKSNYEYRLPNEKEWEFIAKSGDTFDWNQYKLENYVWYEKNSHYRTHGVGQKKSTLWGVYDILGNVWEWCDNKQVRGGSWGSPTDRILKITFSNSRGYLDFDNKMGFRLIREIKKENLNNKILNSLEPQMIKILNSLSIDTIKIPNKNYEMGKYPITIAEYMHFAKDTDSHYPEWVENNSKYKNMNLSDNAPVIGVSWYDAVAYCEWLSEKTGKMYRLPTSEEWEYSARAETTTNWSFGNDKEKLEDYAWYIKNSKGTTHTVGKKLPNPWGLYDIHGNIWEWCEDWYRENKIYHGGSWSDIATDTYLSFSHFRPLFYKSNVRGFRILKEYYTKENSIELLQKFKNEIINRVYNETILKNVSKAFIALNKINELVIYLRDILDYLFKYLNKKYEIKHSVSNTKIYRETTDIKFIIETINLLPFEITNKYFQKQFLEKLKDYAHKPIQFAYYDETPLLHSFSLISFILPKHNRWLFEYLNSNRRFLIGYFSSGASLEFDHTGRMKVRIFIEIIKDLAKTELKIKEFPFWIFDFLEQLKKLSYDTCEAVIEGMIPWEWYYMVDYNNLDNEITMKEMLNMNVPSDKKEEYTKWINW
jgi:formylglycine-generating enzyme required for sulfatase activity